MVVGQRWALLSVIQAGATDVVLGTVAQYAECAGKSIEPGGKSGMTMHEFREA